MKVVFVAPVEGNKPGDVKEVADGYARNFLLPRGLAKAATPEQLKLLQSQKEVIAKRDARAKAEAEELAAKIGGTHLTLKAKAGAQKRLHGSITAQNVVDALKKEHQINVDRHDVDLPESIKRLGDFELTVHVGHGLSPKLKVTVEEE